MNVRMNITTKNAWFFELAFVIGSTCLISFFQVFTWTVLNNIIWVYSILVVGSYYFEHFLVEGNLLMSSTERMIFMGTDLFLGLLSIMPILLTLLSMVPSNILILVQMFMLQESKWNSWVQVSISPLFYAPFLMGIHTLALAAIRLFINMGVLMNVLVWNGFYAYAEDEPG